MNPATNVIIGGSGLGVSEVASNIEIPTSAETSEIIKVVVQVIIAVATLLGLFKRKPKTDL